MRQPCVEGKISSFFSGTENGASYDINAVMKRVIGILSISESS